MQLIIIIIIIIITLCARKGESLILRQVAYSNCEVDNSAPHKAKGKNEWRYISTPPTCLYGIKRDFFIG
jgi:hypothetical protein